MSAPRFPEPMHSVPLALTVIGPEYLFFDEVYAIAYANLTFAPTVIGAEPYRALSLLLKPMVARYVPEERENVKGAFSVTGFPKKMERLAFLANPWIVEACSTTSGLLS